MDARPRLTLDAVARLFKQRNQRLAPGPAARELDGGLYLGQHRPAAEMPLLRIALCLDRAEVAQPFLTGLAKADGDLFDRSQDDSEVCVQRFGQLARGKVLVDHRGDTA